jgi:GAF domain-containing protein
LLPAISAVEIDAHNGSLTAEQRTSALQRIHDIIDDLADLQDSNARTREPDSTEIAPGRGTRVLCIPANAYRDELGGEMLVQLLRAQGFQGENAPARLNHQELVDRATELRPECICISVLPPSSLAQARRLSAIIGERLGSVTIIVGIWSPKVSVEKIAERLRAVHVRAVVVSLTDAVLELSKVAVPITDEMLPAPIPADEEARLAELKGLNLLDTAPEAEFDQVTERLTRLFKVPIALVTLVDKNRQWFKSQAGLPADLVEARSAPRDVSICGHVVANNEVLIVHDLARDPRFANNPWLREYGLRFYAGVPLRGPNGFPVGSLCILDTKPRDMSPHEQDLLKMIAAEVMEQIKRRPVGEKPAAAETEKI